MQRLRVHQVRRRQVAGCKLCTGNAGIESESNYLIHTVKTSLMSWQLPNVASITVTRIEGRIAPENKTGLRNLKAQWKSFQQLSQLDRDCAASLGRGDVPKDIAALLDASIRTVENHRAKILEHLKLDNVCQLGHLLCRFQDAGFEDFEV